MFQTIKTFIAKPLVAFGLGAIVGGSATVAGQRLAVYVKAKRAEKAAAEATRQAA